MGVVAQTIMDYMINFLTVGHVFAAIKNLVLSVNRHIPSSPVLACWVFIFGTINMAYPKLLGGITKKRVVTVLKLTMSWMITRLVWEPLHGFYHLAMEAVLPSSYTRCFACWMPLISIFCAAALFIASMAFTGYLKKILYRLATKIIQDQSLVARCKNIADISKQQISRPFKKSPKRATELDKLKAGMSPQKTRFRPTRKVVCRANTPVKCPTRKVVGRANTPVKKTRVKFELLSPTNFKRKSLQAVYIAKEVNAAIYTA